MDVARVVGALTAWRQTGRNVETALCSRALPGADALAPSASSARLVGDAVGASEDDQLVLSWLSAMDFVATIKQLLSDDALAGMWASSR